MTVQQEIIPKYAHTSGQTRLAYTPDGRFLLTVGTNRLVRRFTVDSADEPATVEHHEGDILGITASDKHYATCSEDGTAALFDVGSNELVGLLSRQALPLREATFSRDGEWVALAGDDTAVRLINAAEPTRTRVLRGHRQGVKHVSFHPTDTLVTTSSTDGAVRVYNVAAEPPELVRTLDGVTAATEPADETCTRAVWHPDGRAFAVQTKSRDVLVIARAGWTTEGAFTSGHTAAITDLAWSPNGAYLATAGADGRIVLWATRTQQAVATHEFRNVVCVGWHPAANTLAFTTNQGQLYVLDGFVPAAAAAATPAHGKITYPAPIKDDEDYAAAAEYTKAARARAHAGARARPASDDESDGGWIEDDDGAGYARAAKRQAAEDERAAKRQAVAPPRPAAFQPGSTPWQNGRRYLALNTVGYVWAVDQDTHHTVTVSFFDRGANREYHFTDHFLYDKACLGEDAALFANGGPDGSSQLFFRHHASLAGSWDTAFDGETVEAIALAETAVVACTSRGYVRVLDRAGTPLRVWRQAASPVVCLAAAGDVLLSVRAPPAGGLTYSLDNVASDATLQRDQVLDVAPGSRVESVLFSAEGDPYMLDSDGVLLVLVHWQQPGQARWVPVLDTRTVGQAGDHFWPLGVAGERFSCIVLRNGERQPYIPLPVAAEIELAVPVHGSARARGDASGDAADRRRLEAAHVSGAVALALAGPDPARELALDKTLLQLFQLACRAGRDAGALGLARLVRTPAALAAASKIALRYDLSALAAKVQLVHEARM
ncbi:WD40-repeat-containing domain protein [Dipodascopsis tothii]|uniref:WD40-repeat-containing domain protein n=1 Tax=Dipodascopsis tothii TaxID=44089 RepID=UPI0034D00149